MQTTIVCVFVFTFLISFCLCELLNIGSNGCKPCDDRVVCPQLPAERCERGRRPCGCCDECAGNLNDKCSALTVRCATGLKCVNGKGEALERVPWYMLRYEGTCQNVVVSPVVIENTDVEERRIRI